MDLNALEIAGAARFFLDSCDITQPLVDVREMARMWGLDVVNGHRTKARLGVIEVDARQSWVDQRFDLAHELGHIVAKHVGLNSFCERTASGIGAAVLMPEGAFKCDLGNYQWDLGTLTDLYGVSYEVAARRVCEVKSAVVSVWIGRRLVRRWRSEWLQGRGFSRRRVPAWERELVASEVRRGEAQAWRDGDMTWVVTPAEAWEQFTLQAVLADRYGPPALEDVCDLFGGYRLRSR